MSEQNLVPSTGGGVSSVNGETGSITFTSNGATVAITKPTGSTINLETSGSGAPTAATYVTLTNNGALTGNRTLAVTSSFSITDGGATNPVTLGLATIGAYSILSNNTAGAAVPVANQILLLGTPGYATTGVNFAQLTTTSNNFAQLSLQNTSAGASASSDYILTADTGNDSTNYADFGINNSTGATTPFTNALATYLYTTTPELDIAALGASGTVKVYTTGGVAAPVLAATFTATQGLTVVGAIAASNFSGTSSGTNTGDQTITLTGDVTGSGTGSFAATLKNTGTAGTYGQVTTDAQGRVTSGGANTVPNGGTGVTTITGLVKGNAAAAFTAAAAGTDYQAPITLTTTGTTGAATFVSNTLNIPQYAAGGGTGTVTSVSVVSANGFAGTVATATTTPAITISTSITGVLKGNGTAISAAVAGTDYSAGTNALTTGILKSTTTTGALSIAIAADFPTLNQSTTGSAATLTTARTISITGDLAYTSPAFDGSTNITALGTLATVNAGTGSFGSSTSIPNFTVNGKGLITATGSNAVIAPAGTLSGAVLNATVVTSSLTSVGTLAALAVTATITGSVSGNAATVTTNANLTGPITSSGNATTITAAAVTYAKIQNETASTLLGNPTVGAQAPSEITLGASLAFSGSTLAVATNPRVGCVGVAFDGGGSAVTVNKKNYITCPFAGTITGWDITVDTGTCTIDIWKIATGTAVPTVTNTITATATPAISTGTAIRSSTLTAWTTAVAAGDIFAFNVNAVSGATLITLTLEISKT